MTDTAQSDPPTQDPTEAALQKLYRDAGRGAPRPAAKRDLAAALRDKSKSPSRALAGRLSTEVGLNPAQISATVEILVDHLQDYYSQVRDPGVLVHTAVSITEPAGRPIKHCRVVPVLLTGQHEADLDVLREHGSVELRLVRLYRWCCEARRQGGLLSHEDLRVLLGVDISTVGDLVRRLEERGLFPPTRGRVKDIGPEPTHKRLIADLLGRGFSTSQIRAMTNHSEGAIGRYQHQFALVVHLLHTYPDASDDERRLLADLGSKAYDAYVEVFRELACRSDCRPHLERLRRRYELDPDGLAGQLPAGKAPRDLAPQRLEQQTLGNAIRQTIQDDLATTERVAEVVAEDVTRLVDESVVPSESTLPGEVVVFVDAQASAPVSGEKITDRKVVPVRLPLQTEETREVWRSDEPVGRRRARVAARLAVAADEQDGVCSVANLAELLFVSPSTLAKDLKELVSECRVEVLTKGLLEDAGPTLTHKQLIVGLDRFGLTGEEISWLTRHTPHSRDRYVETYRRVEIVARLEGRIPEPREIARLLHLRLHVAQEYVDLLQANSDTGGSQDTAGASPAEQLPVVTGSLT